MRVQGNNTWKMVEYVMLESYCYGLEVPKNIPGHTIIDARVLRQGVLLKMEKNHCICMYINNSVYMWLYGIQDCDRNTAFHQHNLIIISQNRSFTMPSHTKYSHRNGNDSWIKLKRWSLTILMTTLTSKPMQHLYLHLLLYLTWTEMNVNSGRN